MLVSIIGSKICYGADLNALGAYIAHIQNSNAARLNGCMPNLIDWSQMTDSQFVRFKNAGRQHASSTPGKTVGLVDRTRADRTGDANLNKWDVAPYGDLTGRGGPWGGGALTNRDHMTANSSNQLQFGYGTWSGFATSRNAVKDEGLAITVSGRHHREASYTYGGRTKKTDTPDGTTRMTFGATHPTDSFYTEMREMLTWKSNHVGKDGLTVKNTLRLEMVGAYAYMYKVAVEKSYVQATLANDTLLNHWIGRAVANDDGKARS